MQRTNYVQNNASPAADATRPRAAGRLCAPSIERYADTEPRLDIGDYFQGQTRAWGMVQDYRGEVQRRFTVLIDGRYDGQTLVLDEAFVFDDGETQRRV